MSTTNRDRWISAKPAQASESTNTTWLRLTDIERIDVEQTFDFAAQEAQGGEARWRVLFTIKGTHYLHFSDHDKGKAEDAAFKLMRLVEVAHTKDAGGPTVQPQSAQPSLGDMLRRMRLHSLGLVFFGGPVLHNAVGTPTERETADTALNKFVEDLPHELRAETLQSLSVAPVWDLNKVEASDAAVAVARSIHNATCKV